VLGAHWLLVVSDLRDEAATTDEIGRVAMAARSAGVGLGVEYMDWTTPSDPLSAVRIAAAADCHVVVDVLHHYRVGAGLAQIRGVVDSGRLGWLQLCDASLVAPDDLLHEARHGRLAPGAGMLPLRDVVAELPAGVSISVEVQSDALARAMTVQERSAHLASSAQPYVRRR
jgi:sugar phosphate isomerase/epimerase